MTLFHGTSSSARQSIKAHGLRPRARTQGTWCHDYHSPSISDSVYLTNQWIRALWYAARTALLTDDSHGMIVTLRHLHHEQCAPDEMVLKPGHDYLTKEDMAACQETIQQSTMTWQESLRQCGMMRYRGTISPDHCINYTDIPLCENPWRFLCIGTVEEFDWAMTYLERVMAYYDVKGVDVARLSEYAIHKERQVWSVTIPDHETIEVRSGAV